MPTLHRFTFLSPLNALTTAGMSHAYFIRCDKRRLTDFAALECIHGRGEKPLNWFRLTRQCRIMPGVCPSSP